MQPTVHDDFERTPENDAGEMLRAIFEQPADTQAPNLRAANEHHLRRIAELEEKLAGTKAAHAADYAALDDRIGELQAQVQRLKNNPEMPPTHFFIARDGSAWQRIPANN